MPFLTPNTLPTSFVCRTVKIPDDMEWIEIVNGALSVLTHVRNFELFGSVTPEQCAEVYTEMFWQYQRGETCMVGTINLYAAVTLPSGTLACDGTNHLRVDFPALYAVLPSVFIVDSNTFKTPTLYQGSDLKYGIIAL
jgi:hypothetical protein